jgi:hypothetical protein
MIYNLFYDKHENVFYATLWREITCLMVYVKNKRKY